MEKKTIGGFIAALRKANGMTQRELAERLNVSDKTVSRWERDDGSPDLAVIPVIAEIFGVTCDELLRGERRSPAQREIATDEGNETSPKGEKQRRRLLNTTLSQYKTRSFITLGIAALGPIAALICSLFFYLWLGFYICLAFGVIASICQAVFVNKALLSADDDNMSEELSTFKVSVISLAKKVYGVALVFIALSLPLWPNVSPQPGAVTNPLLWRIAWAAAALFVYAVVLFFVNPHLIASGKLPLSEAKETLWRANRKIKKILAGVLILVLLVTFLAHTASTELWGPFSIAESLRFDDYDSFVEFMEKDVPYEDDTVTDTHAPQEVPGSQKWYDKYGNEISEDEANTYTLEDENGEVVCTFIRRNKSAVSWRYSPSDGSALPIYVITHDSMAEAKEKAETRSSIFALVYVLECAVTVAVYFILRKKKTV